MIGLSVKAADGKGNFRNVKPGDNVCIAAGSRVSLTLRNFDGAAGAPVVFRNFGGAVVFDGSAKVALKVQSTSHLRLTGSGEPPVKYGLQVRGTYKSGLKVDSESSDVEIDHIQVGRTTGGRGIELSSKSVRLHSNLIEQAGPPPSPPTGLRVIRVEP
ncbi:MAG: hypothetical protein EHM61_17545 [Acidobacteria bacterium]|nr:MAG: hypothetical protein EHM61_17545 [Acidobacteriota bacterium]